MLTLLLLLACADDVGTSDDSAAADDSAAQDDSGVTTDDSGAADDSASDDSGDTQPTSQAPSLSACYAECYLHNTGDQYYQWQVACTASDADGFVDEDNNPALRGGVEVTQGGSLVHTDLIACTREGHCTGSFSESNSGLTCALATQYSFTVQVTDAEGNASEPVTVQGRQR